MAQNLPVGIFELMDEFDAMSDFGIHLEFDINDMEESEGDEISWQDLCEILCDWIGKESIVWNGSLRSTLFVGTGNRAESLF